MIFKKSILSVELRYKHRSGDAKNSVRKSEEATYDGHITEEDPSLPQVHGAQPHDHKAPR